MLRFDAVIFDLDGTLVDSFTPIAGAVNAARGARGLPAITTAEVSAHVGRGLEALLADLVGPARVEDAVRVFRERYAETYLDGTRALPGAVRAVRDLAEAGVRLAVASNKPARFGGPIVENIGLGAEIEVVLGPDASRPPKPEPRMLHEARTLLGADAARTLYVGDMRIDVLSARRAGLAHVLVAGGSTGLGALAGTRGAWVIPQISYLQSFVRRNSGGLPGDKCELDTAGSSVYRKSPWLLRRTSHKEVV